ncbi:1-acyl-sn-glycerol-3-phosphate acyltransferase [candidate division KSB1 bacterium]|nr:1-acyl-sn-glycerol-3-phosphate acyltransferase [candidate division KSB1 bacterium]
MRYILSVFIWLYGSVLFFLIIFFVTILAIFFPPKIYNRPGQWLMRLFVRACGGRVKVEGLENFKHDANYIFMPNHVSFFDIPLLGGFVPNYVRGLQAAEQFRWPVFGWFISRIGNIPIERKSARASLESLKHAAQRFRSGTSIVIMPEGTRTRTGELQKFKKMPFQLVKLAEADIVPIGLSGLHRFKARNSWVVHPGEIKVKFGELVLYKNVKDLALEDLRDLVRSRIAALIECP